jgi:hypothetical protein
MRIARQFQLFALMVVVSLCISAVASAKDDNSGKKRGKKLPKHARELQAQINTNATAIENIELTVGPKGDTGVTGATGPAGADGVDGINGTNGIGNMNTACNDSTTGMIRYNTDNSTFEGCNGADWVSLNTTQGSVYAIGDNGPAGGIVFYVTDEGLHGMEAAPEDHNIAVSWGCFDEDQDGADGTAVGTGAQNTNDMLLAGCSEPATIVDEYTLGGFDDWFLPSKDELLLLYAQKDVVGGFTSEYIHWSSTELSPWWVYGLWFGWNSTGNGADIVKNVNQLGTVRPVRAF